MDRPLLPLGDAAPLLPLGNAAPRSRLAARIMQERGGGATCVTSGASVHADRSREAPARCSSAPALTGETTWV
ncbi:hypothetical protein WME90_28120 [Sorangium sp. So ce375]|uniref:hypothetical protein n=1 Tax=Sorangium sp. So ce375 TaxID=3133306 RepID=UPI003F5B4C91